MTKMSNSPLVSHTKISPNSTNPRSRAITKITIHHMAGNLSVESCGNVFASAARKASSNYGIGTDGRVGMYVEEKNRSWASSSSANDNQAVTIEVSNSASGGDWPVSDAAYKKLIELCTDICKRNGIKKLNYTGDSSGSLTLHNMFAPTACPGPWLQGRMSRIAAEVNRKLNSEPEEDEMTEKRVREIIREELAGLGTKPSGWAEKELAEAVSAKITDGSNPQGYATREQAAIMVLRAAKQQNPQE